MLYIKNNIFLIISLEFILQTKQKYYISFVVFKIDDCLSKIYKNNNNTDILYEKPSNTECNYMAVPNNPVILIEYIFGDELYFEIFDKGWESYIGVNARINEYLIKPELQKFWECVDCKTDDGKYIYNTENNLFYFYQPNNKNQDVYFHIYFEINTEEELINLNNVVDKGYYTLNQTEIIYNNNLINLDSIISLINFKNKTNFFVTHNKNHIIPFETIYFKIKFDYNLTHDGEILGFNHISKNCEELHDNDSFEINDEYYELKYKFSEREKNNHGSHIKIYIMTYNSPTRLNLSQTVSNLGVFEYYFCLNGYNKCDLEFYLNCIQEFKCYESCPNKIYTDKKCNYCHSDCKTCNEIFNEKSSNCLSCLSPNKYLKFGNCVSECKNGYYNDTKDPSIKICKCDLENCFTCSLESLSNNNSCITCNTKEGYFQLYDENNLNDNDNNNTYIKCYKFDEGYYLDKKDSFYKKCFESCKYCDMKGNELFHNCLVCKDNYNYIIQFGNHKNCYINCSYYYYLDNDINQLFCTEKMECDGKYNKLILGTRECIDNCSKVFQYKFRNICYQYCPEGTNTSIIKPYFCEVICNEQYPLELIDEQICVNNCTLSQMKKKICLIKYEDNKNEVNETKNDKEEDEVTTAQDVILENFNNELMSGNYDTSDLDKGEDEIYEDKKMVITLTTSENQAKNKKTNYTNINLGECETLLREHYKISEDKKLYIKKIEVPLEGMKIPKIEYDVYCKLYDNKLIQLNLSVCDNIKIDISIPIVITEDIQKLNSSSEYYNDICHSTTSIYGTDLTLKDRRNEFIKENKTVCQDNCVFSEYNYNINQANCQCDVQKSSSFFKDINIYKDLLIKNFMNVKNIANINILRCYHELFTKKGLLHNIGFYILIIIEIIHIICAIIFYSKELKIIDNQIDEINYAINNWDLVVVEKERMKMLKKAKRKSKKKNLIYDNLNIIQKNKKETINEDDDENKKKEDLIKIPSPIDFYYMGVKKYVHMTTPQPYEPVKKRTKKKKNCITDNSSTVNAIKSKKNRQIIDKCQNIMSFNYYELNNLSYKLALKYDQRTYCEYYLSLLKTKHILFFIFFNNSDYNSRIIKLDLFFIYFAITYAVSALFFREKTIEKIAEDKGSFNFSYQIPQILYSWLISAVLNAILKLLALSEGDIIEYKKNKDKNELSQRQSNLNQKLKYKFFLYFILGFILLLLFIMFLRCL